MTVRPGNTQTWGAIEQVREALEAHVRYADAINVPETATEERDALAALSLLADLADAAEAFFKAPANDVATEEALEASLNRVRAGADGGTA